MTRFEVEQGDILTIPADLLLLKFASFHFGVDEVVSRRLVSAGLCQHQDTCPSAGSFSIIPTKGHIVPALVMFQHVPGLYEFDYEQMQAFAARALKHLHERQIQVSTISTTIHGTGYGLDATEALHSLVLGFTQGLLKYPGVGTRCIKFVESNEKRIRLLQQAIGTFGTALEPSPGSSREQSTTARDEETQVPERERGPVAVPVHFPVPQIGLANTEPTRKEHIFVAMPFTEEYEDVYEFGIYGPVRECGYICEKVDQASFTGDILERIRNRISTAKLVIADLSDARPNVYLEVGYAWGLNVPVIFLAREGQKLHFDVQTHRCIFYKSIRQLGRELEKLLRHLDELG
jgi:hypothetical protein